MLPAAEWNLYQEQQKKVEKALEEWEREHAQQTEQETKAEDEREQQVATEATMAEAWDDWLDGEIYRERRRVHDRVWAKELAEEDRPSAGELARLHAADHLEKQLWHDEVAVEGRLTTVLLSPPIKELRAELRALMASLEEAQLDGPSGIAGRSQHTSRERTGVRQRIEAVQLKLEREEQLMHAPWAAPTDMPLVLVDEVIALVVGSVCPVFNVRCPMGHSLDPNMAPQGLETRCDVCGVSSDDRTSSVRYSCTRRCNWQCCRACMGRFRQAVLAPSPTPPPLTQATPEHATTGKCAG